MAHPLEETTVHPLFTVEEDSDDDEIKTVTTIHVARKENGKLVFAPRPRASNELTSLEQIHSEFGGGEYVLIGYNNGRISARRSINLPGKPKPMYDEGIDTPPTPVSQTQTTPVDPMQAMMGGQGGLMGLIMMMMQQMMQQQAQAQASQTQMFIAMMNNNHAATAEEKQQARAELQANIERERITSERTMSLMREIMQSKGGNGGGEDFTRGVEFMRTFAVQQIEVMKAQTKGDDIEWGSILETIAQALQGFGMLKNVAGAVGEGAATVVEGAATAAQ